MARLIDADAMEKTILDFWGCDPAYCMDLNGWDPAMADVCTLERLKNAPTVDAVEVVRCSECILHDSCSTEDVFKFARLNDDRRFCGVGKRKGGDE